MKSALAAFAVVGLLLPGVALADPSDCGRMIQQIKQFEEMADRAEEMGKDDWAAKTDQHIGMLEARLDMRCPAYAERDDDQKSARRVALALKFAVDVAAKVLSMGTYSP